MSWGTGVPIYLSVDHTLLLLVHMASDYSLTYKHSLPYTACLQFPTYIYTPARINREFFSSSTS